MRSLREAGKAPAMTRLLVALLVLVVLLPSPHPAAATAQAETWPTGTPEAHGFDSVRLADVLPTIQKQVPGSIAC